MKKSSAQLSKKLRNLFTLTLLCLLVACSHFQKQPESSTQQEIDKPQIDPSVLQRCPELPTLERWSDKVSADGTMTLGNFALVYGELQGQYITCAIRHDHLIEAVKGDSAKAEQRNSIND